MKTVQAQPSLERAKRRRGQSVLPVLCLLLTVVELRPQDARPDPAAPVTLDATAKTEAPAKPDAEPKEESAKDSPPKTDSSSPRSNGSSRDGESRNRGSRNREGRDRGARGVSTTAPAAKETAPANPATKESAAATPPSKEASKAAALEEPAASGGAATNAPAPGPRDYAAYKIIHERNIFNANRSPRRGREEKAPVQTAPKQIQIDTFTLVGTLSSEQGEIAFFDGSGSDFRKAVKLGASMAGYTVRQVEQSHVKLEAAGKEVVLKVGGQMRREDGGPWANTTPPERGPAGIGSAAASDDAPASAEEAELLRKLMEKREKESNK